MATNADDVLASPGKEAPAPTTDNPAAGAPPSALSEGITEFANTASFGGLSAAGAVVDSLGATDGRPNIWNSNQGLTSLIASNKALNDHILSAGRDADPEAATIGGLAGYLAPTASIGFGGRTLGAFVKGGIIQGAIRGGVSADSLGDAPGAAAEGAAEGAALAPVGYGVGKVLGGAAKAVWGKLTGQAAEDATAAASPAADTPTAAPASGGSAAPEVMPEVRQQMQAILDQSKAGDDSAQRIRDLAAQHGLNPDDFKGLDAAVGKKGAKIAPITATQSIVPEAASDTIKSGFEGVAIDPANPPKVVGWGHDADGNRAPVLAPAATAEQTTEQAAAAPPIEAAPTGEAPSTTATPPTDRESLASVQQSASEWLNRIHTEGEASADLPSSSPQGQWKLGNLGSSDENTALVRAIAPSVQLPAGTSDDTLLRAAASTAKELGTDPQTALNYGKALADTMQGQAQHIAAFRTIAGEATQEYNALFGRGTNIDWSTADDSLVNTALEAVRNRTAITQQLAQVKQGAGQSLRVLGLPNAEKYLAYSAAKEAALAAGEEPPPPLFPGKEDTPREFPPLPTTREELQQHQELLAMFGGDPERAEEWRKQMLTTSPGMFLRTSLANSFTASILSSASTIMMHWTGPFVSNILRNVERTSGALSIMAAPWTSAEDRSAAFALARSQPSAMLGLISDIGDAVRWGIAAGKENNVIISGAGNHGRDLSMTPLSANLMEAANIDPNWMYSTGNFVNMWPRAFRRLQNGLHEMALRLTYNNLTRVSAATEAAQQGLGGQDARDFIQQRMQGAYDEAGVATDQQLMAATGASTMLKPVGADDGKVRSIMNWISSGRQTVPELRYIIPVMNVAANDLGEVLRRVPFLPQTPGLNKVLGFAGTAADLAGENGLVAQAEAHGRFMSGAAALGFGAMLTHMGLLTGSGPVNPHDQRVWRETGRTPYSINTHAIGALAATFGIPVPPGEAMSGGGEWISLQKMGPMGALMTIPATISDAAYRGGDDKDLQDRVMAGAGAIAQWFRDRAAMRGVADVLNVGSDPTNNLGHLLPRLVGGTIGGFVPGIFGSTVNGWTDADQRLKATWEDYVKSHIPVASNTLEPVRNIMGEPQLRTSQSFPFGLLPVTMSHQDTFMERPDLDEAYRLYKATGYAAGANPTNLAYGTFDPMQVKLENGRSLYDNYMQARQTVQVNGETLRQAITNLVTSDDYQHGSDGDATHAMDVNGNPSRAYLMSHIFQTYNDQIKTELAGSSPIANKWLTAATAKRAASASLRGTQASDLVDNPALYAAHGVDAQQFSDKLTAGSSGQLLQALSH